MKNQIDQNAVTQDSFTATKRFQKSRKGRKRNSKTPAGFNIAKRIRTLEETAMTPVEQLEYRALSAIKNAIHSKSGMTMIGREEMLYLVNCLGWNVKTLFGGAPKAVSMEEANASKAALLEPIY